MKKEIVARLLEAKHITFDEALILMGINDSIPYQFQPYPSPPPIITYTETTTDLDIKTHGIEKGIYPTCN